MGTLLPLSLVTCAALATVSRVHTAPRPSVGGVEPRVVSAEPRQVDAALEVACQETAHDQGCVGAAREFEGHPDDPLAALVPVAQVDLEVTGPDEQAPVLALELEAAHARDAELGGGQALVGQRGREQPELRGVFHVLEPLAG
jgi:hypothetical protein